MMTGQDRLLFVMLEKALFEFARDGHGLAPASCVLSFDRSCLDPLLIARSRSIVDRPAIIGSGAGRFRWCHWRACPAAPCSRTPALRCAGAPAPTRPQAPPR